VAVSLYFRHQTAERGFSCPALRTFLASLLSLVSRLSPVLLSWIVLCRRSESSPILFFPWIRHGCFMDDALPLEVSTFSCPSVICRNKGMLFGVPLDNGQMQVDVVIWHVTNSYLDIMEITGSK
jgi:hypothetical protein